MEAFTHLLDLTLDKSQEDCNILWTHPQCEISDRHIDTSSIFATMKGTHANSLLEIGYESFQTVVQTAI